MIRRILELCRAALALIFATALLGAVPLLLIRFGGVPVVGTAEALTNPLASDNTRATQLITGALLLIAWFCWAQLAYALVVEAAAEVRGSVTRRRAMLPGIQALAARVVGSVTLIFTSLNPPIASAAAPLSASIDIEAADPITPAATSITHAGPATGATTLGADSTAPTGQTYTLSDRDTLWNLADKFLGDGLRWREIRDANTGRTMADGTVITERTEMIEAGSVLVLPADAVLPLTAAATESAPAVGPMVDVDPGEHIWQLAGDTLATAWGRTPADHELAPYWADMVELNLDRLLPPGDPDLVYPGQHLLAPPTPTDPNLSASPAPAPVQVAAPSLTVEPADAAPPAEPAAPEDTTATVTTPLPTFDEAPAIAPPATIPAATMPTATAPEPTAATSGTAVAEADADGAEAGDGVDVRKIALGFGALATGAGGLAVTLRLHRSHQAARRTPGTTPVVPGSAAVAYEARVRPIARSEAVRWLAATNRFLSTQLAAHPHHPMPAVIAARAGELGVEVLLDEPCEPVEGFVADGAAWKLNTDLSLAELEAATADAHPYSPALLPVGATPGGDLHLDLEQLATVALEGHPDVVMRWLRTIATDIATMPWARHCTIVTIGLDGSLDLKGFEQVSVPEDPDVWVNDFEREMRHLQGRLNATPYRRRVQHGEIFHPIIVFVGPEHGGLATRLADIANLINTPVAVLATTPLAGSTRLHLTAQVGTLEPNGINFAPALTEPAEVDQVLALLAAASSIDDGAAPSPVDNGPAATPTDIAAEPPADVAAGIDDSAGVANDPVVDGGEAGDESVDALIDRITSKRPIEVSLLRPRPAVRGLGQQPKPKAESVIIFLAYHRDISTQTLHDTFWRDGARSTVDNAVSQIRQLLGTDQHGAPRLRPARNSSRFELSEDIGCDWTRANTLINTAATRDGAEAISLLAAALQPIEGRIATDVCGPHYIWLQEDHQVYGTIERVLVDAAHRLGELALATGDANLATWAAGQGLLVVPGQEPLLRIQMRAAAARHDSQGIEDAYQTAVRSAQEISPWTDVQPETDALQAELRQQLRAVNANRTGGVHEAPEKAVPVGADASVVN